MSQASISFVGIGKPRSFMAGCTSGADFNDYQRYNNCMSDYNSDLTSITKNRNNEFAPLIIKSLNFETTGTNTGLIIAEVEPTTYPVLKVIVDGEFIGLERLSGTPDITQCISNINEKSGREIIEEFTVKNTGSESGFFLFKGSCNNPKIDIFGTNANVGSGNSRTSDVRIVGSSDILGVTEGATCIIIVEDKVSGKQDSCNFNVAIEFTDQICVPDKNFCNDDATQVLQCGSLGDESSLVKTCGSNQVCGLNENTNEIGCIDKGIDIGGGDTGGSNGNVGGNGDDGKECKWYQDQYEIDSFLFNAGGCALSLCYNLLLLLGKKFLSKSLLYLFCNLYTFQFQLIKKELPQYLTTEIH